MAKKKIKKEEEEKDLCYSCECNNAEEDGLCAECLADELNIDDDDEI